jgi:hypothetical protein
MPSPLPRRDRRWNRVAPLTSTTSAFPICPLGRLPHYKFRGLFGVHSRYGLPARGVAIATLSIEGFGSFVTSATAPIATGWSNSYQVGLTPTEGRRLCTAHGHRLFPREKGRRMEQWQLVRVAGNASATRRSSARTQGKLSLGASKPATHGRFKTSQGTEVYLGPFYDLDRTEKRRAGIQLRP